MDALLERLERIEAKLDHVLNKPPPAIIQFSDCMALTGCRSKTAMQRWLKQYNVKPYAHGKYRRIDIENKVAHLALFGPG